MKYGTASVVFKPADKGLTTIALISASFFAFLNFALCLIENNISFEHKLITVNAVDETEKVLTAEYTIQLF